MTQQEIVDLLMFIWGVFFGIWFYRECLKVKKDMEKKIKNGEL